MASRGETGEPCGVPASLGDDPALEHPGPQPTPQQLQHPPVHDPPFDQSNQGVMVDVVKARLDVSVEHPHPPPLAVTRTASRACWAERFGRNPKLTGRKSASKIGSSTILAAAISTRSPTAGMVAHTAPLWSQTGLGLWS